MTAQVPAPASGPLRVSAANPRYFEDGNGRIVYLTGSHTWPNLKDMGTEDPPVAFDYDAYLDFLVAHNHNFIRLWTWELARYTYDGTPAYATPFPWQRIGPGNALDGKPRFDLARFDPDYFQRLRSRVAAAGERGIYVSIMLFEGHGLHASLEPWCRDGHPFHAANNVNDIDGDPGGTGRVLDTHTLKLPAVTATQEAYVKQVVDTVNDLDNVLYEVTNESGAYSTEWQVHIVETIHDYEKTKPEKHPVGMTFQFAREEAGTNGNLFRGPADWISPNPEGGYRGDPPAADGSKVILTDTDHLWGLGCEKGWVWKSFTRGLNPILMDPYQPFEGIGDHPQWGRINHPDHPLWEPVRRRLGQTRRFALRMDLSLAIPRNDLASTGYCLAAPGREYLVYLPDGGQVTVDLGEASSNLSVEWFDPNDGGERADDTVKGGGEVDLRSPFDDDAVLYLHRLEGG